MMQRNECPPCCRRDTNKTQAFTAEHQVVVDMSQPPWNTSDSAYVISPTRQLLQAARTGGHSIDGAPNSHLSCAWRLLSFVVWAWYVSRAVGIHWRLFTHAQLTLRLYCSISDNLY